MGGRGRLASPTCLGASSSLACPGMAKSITSASLPAGRQVNKKLHSFFPAMLSPDFQISTENDLYFLTFS